MKDETLLILGAGVAAYFLLVKPVEAVGAGLGTAAQGAGAGISETSHAVGDVATQTGETVNSVLGLVEDFFNFFRDQYKGGNGNTNYYVTTTIPPELRTTLPKSLVLPTMTSTQKSKALVEVQTAIQQGYGLNYTLVNQALGLTPATKLTTGTTTSNVSLGSSLATPTTTSKLLTSSYSAGASVTPTATPGASSGYNPALHGKALKK